jgi:hypothetical protein
MSRERIFDASLHRRESGKVKDRIDLRDGIRHSK